MATELNEEQGDRNRTLAAWLFLAVLGAIFTVMALWAYRWADPPSSTFIDAVATTSTTTAPVSLEPAIIAAQVDRARVTLTGSVPDEGARVQLIRIAEAAFGNGNVLDELVVDDGVDLATGSISVSGTAVQDDVGPETLQLQAGVDLGLAAGDFDVRYVAPSVDAASILMLVSGDTVALTGTAPDETVRTRLVGTAEFVYGEGNVDSEGLQVAASTMDGATISIEGTTMPGDLRANELAETAQLDFKDAAIVNNSEIDLSEQALSAFEDQLQAALLTNPILFDVGTSQITDVGVTNLARIAEAINAVPGRGVEIVGHTDNSGSDTLNQTLSESRAEAVRVKLVDLGISSDRLSTRGAGSTEPVVPNNSAENRQRNRRIEFLFDRQG